MVGRFLLFAGFASSMNLDTYDAENLEAGLLISGYVFMLSGLKIIIKSNRYLPLLLRARICFC